MTAEILQLLQPYPPKTDDTNLPQFLLSPSPSIPVSLSASPFLPYFDLPSPDRLGV